MIGTKGITIRRSHHPVHETINILQAYLQQHGATVYARIDQQAEAKRAGITFRPLQFLLFGNPQSGVPVMAQNPLVALDLPLKIVAWEDDQHLVWVAFNKAVYVRERHSLPPVLHDPLDIDHFVNDALNI